MNAAQLLAHFDRLAEVPDAVSRLRRFILDLAMRGKLVEQDLADESATELLRQAHSVRLRAQTKTVKRDAASEGEPDYANLRLPANWRWSKLGNFCTKTGSGSTPSGGKEAYIASGVPFLRSQNIYDDGLRLDSVAFLPPATHDRMSSTAVKPGDLLLNITGGSIGRCAIVPDTFAVGNISQHVAIIRLALPECGRFLHSVIRSDYFQNHIFGNQTGAGREGLPKNRMDEILIPVPPLAEQHRIVAKVDELMALCDQLEAAQQERELRRDRLAAASLQRLNQPAEVNPTTDQTEPAEARQQAQREQQKDHARFHLQNLNRLTTRPEHIKAMRQTVLMLAVRGQLVSQDEAAIPTRTTDASERKTFATTSQFDVPESWTWRKVEQIAVTRLGKMLDKAKNKGTPRRYLRNVNVRWFDFNLSDVHEMPFEDAELEEFALRRGDVLVCEGGEPGRVAVWDERESDIYFQKAIHRVRFSHDVNPHYFANVLREAADSGRLATYFTGVGIKHFTGRGLDSFTVPLPPLAEQHRIVAKVDELMTLCDQLEDQLTQSQTDSRRLLEALLEEAIA